MAAAIAHFISLEAGGVIDTVCRFGALAASRQSASVFMMNVEAVVHMTVKVGGAVIPRAGADEDTP